MIIDNKEKYLVITPAEGYVITSYTEDKDILEYSSFKIAYTPLTADLSIYREITLDEDAAYQASLEEALRNKEMEELNNGRA